MIGGTMSKDSGEPVAADWQPEPDDEFAAELDRRLAAHEANPDDVLTSEQVWDRILGQR